MPRPKIGFLPAFFTALAIAFALALWLRLRAYSTTPVGRVAGETSASNSFFRSPDATSAPLLATGGLSSSAAPHSVPESSATLSAREARRAAAKRIDYTKLPPLPPSARPAPPAPKPLEKPSLFSRIVSPIVSAITGKPSPPRTQSPATPMQQAQSSSGTSRPTGGNPRTDTNGPAVDPKDRSSDTQPPQLISITFNPPEVRDGEETILTVQATDDLSGIRSISGTIAAPSGAVQGFALQKQGEGEQYIAQIRVPKDASEGVWRVNYLSLIDNASNATTMSGAQGALPPTAAFKVVSSRPDSTGPALKAVWLDRPAMKAGEKDTLFVQAEDDKSGVNLVSGVFISPQKHARIGFVCRQGSAAWECEVSTPACIDCGDWRLEQLQLQDKANNMTTVRSDNALIANVAINVAGESCDSTPPALQALALDRTAVSNAEDSVINVTATASDDTCGIMSMSGQVSGPMTGAGQPRLYFSFTASNSQNWAGRISVPKLAAKGVWRVTWIQVLDQGHNLKTYSQGDAALANAAFNVQ